MATDYTFSMKRGAGNPHKETTNTDGNVNVSADVSPIVRTMMGWIAVFFIAVEMTPVGMKLLSPPGPYDVFLSKEVMTAEVHSLLEAAAIGKIKGRFWDYFEEAHTYAYKQLFTAMKNEFVDVRKGNAAPVYRTLWDQLVNVVRGYTDDKKDMKPPEESMSVVGDGGKVLSDIYASHALLIKGIGVSVLVVLFMLPLIGLLWRMGFQMSDSMEIAIALVGVATPIVLARSTNVGR